jgi:regulatory protein
MEEFFSEADGRNKTMDFATAKAKIAKYCAYQERAHTEVTQKLYSFGLYSSQVEEILAWLITENYLNEERFAIAFAGGKFRVKKWGKIKIKQHLKVKKVSEYSINKAIMLIGEDDYFRTLKRLIKQKWDTISAKNDFEKRHKIAQFVINKGYEPETVWRLLKSIIN